MNELYTSQRYEMCPHDPWGRLLEKDDPSCALCAALPKEAEYEVVDIDMDAKTIHLGKL